MTNDTDTYYYFQDGLGSVRNVVDASETVQNTYDYYAFGRSLAATENVTSPWQFTGRYKESGAISNLHFYRNRYYGPDLGQFTSRDAMWADIHRGWGYVGNRPTMIGDPYGEAHPGVVVGVVAVAIVVACAYPQYTAAFDRYPDSGDKFKHCWVACRISKGCGGVISQVAGLGKEARDRAVGAYCALFPESEICQGGHGDFWDSLADLAAHQQCVGWESYLGFQWIGALCRQSCEDCCKDKVGYSL